MLHTTVLVHMGYNRPLREVSTYATNIQSVRSGLGSSRVLYLLATMVHTSYGWSISSIRRRTVWTNVKRNDIIAKVVYNERIQNA